MFVIAVHGTEHHYSVMPNQKTAELLFESTKKQLQYQGDAVDLLEILSDRVVIVKNYER